MALIEGSRQARRDQSTPGVLALVGAVSLWSVAASGFAIQGHPIDAYLPPSFFAMTLANTLLAVSAGLYLAHLLLRSSAAGLWASRSAFCGAAGIGLALLIRYGEFALAASSGVRPHSYLYDVTALFAGGTVLIYLIFERVFRDRSAGAFVMPVVMSAVACEIWLVANGLAIPGGSTTALQPYWRQAFLVASGLGEAAFLVGAGLAGVFLSRALSDPQGVGAESRRAPLGPSYWHAYDAMLGAISIAVPTCVLACAMGVIWLYAAAPSALGFGSAGVVVAVGVCSRLLYLAFGYRANGRRVAGWAILGSGFALAALASVLIVGDGAGDGWLG